jgi:hypothetical protein
MTPTGRGFSASAFIQQLDFEIPWGWHFVSS